MISCKCVLLWWALCKVFPSTVVFEMGIFPQAQNAYELLNCNFYMQFPQFVMA